MPIPPTVDLRIGTSGYSYRDWVGSFYPFDTTNKDMLGFYSGTDRPQADLLDEPKPIFTTVEINATYYKMLEPATFARMAEKTPDDFLFTVKAPSGVTHPDSYKHLDSSLLDGFFQSVAPLAEANKLGPLLLQFPWRFKPAPETIDYLKAVAEQFAGLNAAVEFRHRDWQSFEVLEFLAEHGISYVSVDLPPLRKLPTPLLASTTKTLYVRFHGRRGDTWWTGNNISRYDYDYQPETLQGWSKRIEAAAQGWENDDSDLARVIRLISGPIERVFLFFNNHPQGKAVKAAAALRRMLQ